MFYGNYDPGNNAMTNPQIASAVAGEAIAEARIKELEEMLQLQIKDKNALLAVGLAVIAEFERLNPTHALAQRTARDVIYAANFKL